MQEEIQQQNIQFSHCNIEKFSDPQIKDKCNTYIFKSEDHTLGNSIRFLLTMDQDVEFVGYSIPHPSEDLLNLRIQTKCIIFRLLIMYIYKIQENQTDCALKQSFISLSKLSNCINDKFIAAFDKFEQNQS